MNNRALFSRFTNQLREEREGPLPQESLEEAEKSVLPFLEKGSKSLAVYGIGQGYRFDALRSWLNSSPDHQLVFIEDDLDAVNVFLHSPRAHLLLTHPQVSFVLWQDEGNIP